MTWLMAQMWALLGGAALLGLLIGWGLRGGFLRGRVRRAEVERGVAQTELQQARAEIEGLYEAQRKQMAQPAIDPQELAARDERVASLSEQLAVKTAELESLIAEREAGEAGGNGAGGALASGAVAGTQLLAETDAGDTGADSAQLEWRNRYLESRVRKLESDLHARGPAPSTAEPSTVAGPTQTSEAGDDADATTVEFDKLRWQNAYLNTRLAYFQNRLARPAPVAPAQVSPVDAAPQDVSEPEHASPPSGRETPDEELARLRWRNRYLEGRLAYLEEERGGSVEADEAVAPGQVQETEDAGEVPAADEVAETEAEPVEPEPASVEASTAPTGSEPATVEATPNVNATLPVPIRPPALEAPRDGRPDDLTAIEGIGPRIQDVLNGIGVYHFDQIAGWTPEHAAWVDDYLNFSGRVGREAWVRQAETLQNSETAS